MKLGINNFPEALVDFTAAKITSSSCLWLDVEALAKFDNKVSEWNEQKFLDAFSYGVAETSSFSELTFDHDDKITLQAERYGGHAGGKNGGGSRCGNRDGFQIKGCGSNPLIGSDATMWYSHGSLNLIDAVCEAIYSNVLNIVLPLGAARCFGILVTAEQGSYYSCDGQLKEINRCKGALLVREACLRPAHFLRSRGFNPKPEYQFKLSGDIQRTRLMSRALFSHLDKHENFVKFVGKFLDNCANQYAFASIARIAHGAATPSNMSFDGRWLDLTNVSFLQGGRNFMIGPGMLPSASEYLLPEAIVGEVVDTYAKYNKVDLNLTPLLNYYRQSLKKHFYYHSSFLFGFSKDFLPKYGTSEKMDLLIGEISYLNTLHPKVRLEAPEMVDGDDPIISLIRASFIGLTNTDTAAAQLQNHLKSTPRTLDLITAFNTTFYAVYSTSKSTGNFWNFATSCAIVALRRAYLSGFFYWNRFRRLLEDLASNAATNEEYSKVIEECREVATWVFSEPENQIVYLFKSHALSIFFNIQSGDFSITTPHLTYCYASYIELENHLDAFSDELLTINGFEFKSSLLKIGEVLSYLELARNNTSTLLTARG